MDDNAPLDIVTMSAALVAAYVSNNSVSAHELPPLIARVHDAFASLTNETLPQTEEPSVAKLTPAQIRRSITPDALISFIDGKPYKTLKRHLGSHGLGFSAYRERYGLPSDYPTVAPNYSAARSALAKSLGLGSRGYLVDKASAPAPTPTPTLGKPKRAAARSQKVAEPA